MIRDLYDMLAHRPAVRHQTIRLPDPEAREVEAPDEGYFQVRLAEMRLTDDRRWHQEITPAAFIIGEFAYDGRHVRKPCFISNDMLGQMATGINTRKLRVHFANTLAIGPAPYTGGDVDLFVGLYQAATEDRLTNMFGMFESLFSKMGGGAVAAGVSVANALLPAVMRCLGTSDIKCLLAERRPIVQERMSQGYYLAYLRATDDTGTDTANLQIHGGELKRISGGTLTPVDDIDFCLIRVQCSATRNDCTQLPFNDIWKKARELTTRLKHAEAQAAMMECAGAISMSPDLTESHKIALIKAYQAKLLCLRQELEPAPADPEAFRTGTATTVAGMSGRIRSSGDFDAEQRARTIEEIGRLSLLMDADDIDGELEQAMQAAPRGSRRDTEELLRTLALGTIAVDAPGNRD